MIPAHIRTLHALRAGFTLMELLVVITIIGILVASFSYSTVSARENARIAKATAESRELGNAIRLYAITNQDTTDGDGSDGGDPLDGLGLSEGINEARGTIVKRLTNPSSNDAKTVYFAANPPTLINDNLYDPWGARYRIRVKKAGAGGVNAGSSTNIAEDDYTILVPIMGRHRDLKN